MIREIIFKPNGFGSCKYKQTDEDNVFQPTENTIIICSSADVLRTLGHDVVDTIKGEAEHNAYICDDEDIADIKFITRFQPFYEIAAHNQTIRLSLEAAMIFTTDNIKDVWFAEMTDEGISVYPLIVYKDVEVMWSRDKNRLYVEIMDGRFGKARYKSVCI